MCFKSLLQVFRQGNPSGNLPSPRVDIDLGQFTLPDTIKTTVQNTNSMEPLIDIGHTVFITEIVKDLNVGDIVIWEQGGQTKIHSLIEVDVANDRYRTQGLNVNAKDNEIIHRADIKYLCLGVIWTKGEGYYEAQPGD